MGIPVLLDDRPWFPDPRLALRSGSSNGLVAVGGDLSPLRLMRAYRAGIFPWTDEPLTWWSPDPRAIIELEQFHIPHSLQKTLRRGCFRVTVNQAFREVMGECAAPAPGRRTTWITPNFVEAYARLHEAGHAHSVECWLGDTLAGGVYGVAVGGFFSGESMFHRAPNASKVALCHLFERLKTRGIKLFDIQQLTPVTRQLGGVLIPRELYLSRLKEAVTMPVSF